GIDEAGGLQCLSIGSLQAMDTLLAHDDAAWFALPEQIRPAHVRAGDLEVLERDVRRIIRGPGVLGEPGARIAEIVGIRMVCDVPLEVAPFSGDAGKGVEKVPALVCL